MSFDQIFDLTAGVYFRILCDLNLLKKIPPSPPPLPPLIVSPALSCSNAPLNIEIRQSNKMTIIVLVEISIPN